MIGHPLPRRRAKLPLFRPSGTFSPQRGEKEKQSTLSPQRGEKEKQSALSPQRGEKEMSMTGTHPPRPSE